MSARTYSTVRSSTTFSAVTSLSELATLDVGAVRYSSKIVLSASAFNGVPSWNWTSGRSFSVQVVRSSFGSIDSAR